MEWSDSYGIEKMLPLVTRYEMKAVRDGNEMQNAMVPHRLVHLLLSLNKAEL